MSPSAAPQPTPVRRMLEPIDRFLQVEAASGLVLIAAAVLALIWANLPQLPSYQTFWDTPATIGVGAWVITRSIHFWVNEGLMTVFFLVVGLEIRRELHDGALASWRRAALPFYAAMGGVIVPAILYLAVTSGSAPLRQGWAVPTATDIAFAVGVLTLLGRRAPPEIRALLLALAVIDDIAAIIIIGVFCSHDFSIVGLMVAAGATLVVLLFQRAGIRSAWLYVVPAIVIWSGILAAGVHPAIAGVLLGLLTPVNVAPERDHARRRVLAALSRFTPQKDATGKSTHELAAPLREIKDAQIDLLPPVLRVQDALHPWVAFAVMPLFAFANAGIDLRGLHFDATFLMVLAGVGGGLLLGKPLGIAIAALFAIRMGWCEWPARVPRSGVLVIGCLGGIGFTMAIFIADLAFDDQVLLAAMKFAVLAASALAAVVGYGLGRRVLVAVKEQPESHQDAAVSVRH